MSRDTGGPAFPQAKQEECSKNPDYGLDGGMSMRDYFSARAPMPIPDWFKYVPHTPRPTEPTKVGFTMPQIEKINSILNVANEFSEVEITGDPEIDGYIARKFKAKNDMRNWHDEQRSMKFFAWRWYYADKMLLERSK